MIGIADISVYLPQSRLLRSAIADAHAWAIPNLKNQSSGTIAASGWDEDVVTMAHESARRIATPRTVKGLSVCSTSAPFADRSHATLLCEALLLDNTIRVQDVSASQRASSSTLMAALESGREGELVVASERRKARPGSVQEISNGDAAVSVITGSQNLLAEYVASASINADFVDHYRSSDSPFDYAYEDRWIRDEGFLKLIPDVIAQVANKAGIKSSQIDRFVFNAPANVVARITKAAGLATANTKSTIAEKIGRTGCVAPLLGLSEALENCSQGQLILCVSFGQGADALLLRASQRAGKPGSFSKAVDAGVADVNYLRFLSHRKLIDMDWGMRAEREVRTAQSAYYRERAQILAMVGGQCVHCDTTQFPKTQACVNPQCRKIDEQKQYSFAAEHGQVKSFTEDWQAYSPAPPLMYGNIEFSGGANIYMQFTDTTSGQINVGDKVGLHFRIKDIDTHRNYRRYFWKARLLGAQ